MKKLLFVAGAIVALFSSTNVIAFSWGSSSVVEQLNVYPGYVLVVQGSSQQGGAGCSNNNIWGFSWSQFSDSEQKRILSILLLAKSTGSDIKVGFDDTSCGPEGHKKFSGHIIIL